MSNFKLNYGKLDRIGEILLQDHSGEHYVFTICRQVDHLLYGTPTNSTFLIDGVKEIDDCFSLDENIQELIADIEAELMEQ